MKYLLLTIAACAITSCKKISSEFEVSELDYGKHSYVIFESEYGGVSAVHNPDCKCYYERSI